VIVFPALMIFAGSYDIMTMTIPNRLSLALIAAFALSASLLGIGWTEAGMHVGAGLLVLAAGLGMFAAGWVGGGDVKLAAATALWLGFGQLLEYFFVASLAGGALTVLILALRQYPLPATAQSWTWLDRLHNPANGVPYGVALAFGGLVVFPSSAMWLAAFAG
jgi:prepilin peptidase CpaA